MLKHLRQFMFLASAFVCVVGQIHAASPTLFNRTGKVVIPAGNASYGGPFEMNWAAMPTMLTDVATATVHITGLCVVNTTAAPITLTIQTKDMVPVALPLSGPLAANASACFSFSQGLRSNGGFSVQAGGAGVNYGAVFVN